MRIQLGLVAVFLFTMTACTQEQATTSGSASSDGVAPEVATGSTSGEMPAGQGGADTPVLDLSSDAIRETLDEIDDETPELQASQALLPEMFDDQTETPSTRVSGGVLTREDAESLQDSLDGVEIKLEMETR